MELVISRKSGMHFLLYYGVPPRKHDEFGESSSWRCFNFRPREKLQQKNVRSKLNVSRRAEGLNIAPLYLIIHTLI